MSESGGGGEMLTAVAIGCLLAAGSALGADSLVPFYSVTFVGGTAAVFYLAVSYGPRPALAVSASILVAGLLQGLGEGGEKLQAVMVQAPFLVTFFLGFATIPIVVPTLLSREREALDAEIAAAVRKIDELKRTMDEERKTRVEEKGSAAKEETVRVTSRITQLTTFLRETLQAASTKEILNLLFSNTTKSYGNLEVGLLLPVGDGEILFSKVAHPDHARIENKRIPLAGLPILASAMTKSVPVLLPERIELHAETGFSARILVAIQGEQGCEAVLTLGRARQEGELSAEDARFLGCFGQLAAEAIGQLKVVLAS